MTKRYLQHEYQAALRNQTDKVEYVRDTKGVHKLAAVLGSLSMISDETLYRLPSTSDRYFGYFGTLDATELENTVDLYGSIQLTYDKPYDPYDKSGKRVPVEEIDELPGGLENVDISINGYAMSETSQLRFIHVSMDVDENGKSNADEVDEAERILSGVAEVMNYQYRPVETGFNDQYTQSLDDEGVRAKSAYLAIVDIFGEENVPSLNEEQLVYIYNESTVYAKKAANQEAYEARFRSAVMRLVEIAKQSAVRENRSNN